MTYLRVHDQGRARWLTLCNPLRKNAIGPRMIGEMLQALAEVEHASRIRVVVISGEGNDFCAGGDFSQMASEGGVVGDYAELLLRLTRYELPVIARVRGTAMGGGLGLVAASHFAIADESAVFATPEIKVGLFPMMIMALLDRLVPKRELMNMMLLGEKLSAQRALELGMVSKVVASDSLDFAVDELVGKLCDKSGDTLRLGLRAYGEQSSMSLAEALPMLRTRLGELLATPDAQEGLVAFMQKRAPVWPSEANQENKP